MWWPGMQDVPAVVFAWFVMIAGVYWRPRLGWRWVRLAAGFVASWWPAAWVGLTAYGILGKWTLLLPVLSAAALGGPPIGWAIVGGTYAIWYGLWDWGLVLLLWSAGAAWGAVGFTNAHRWVPTWAWVRWLGRHSLGVYVVHLWALAGLVAITGHSALW